MMQKDLLFILQGEPTFIVVSCENDMYLCRELVHRNIGESLPHFSLEGQLIVNYNISICYFNSFLFAAHNYDCSGIQQLEEYCSGICGDCFVSWKKYQNA